MRDELIATVDDEHATVEAFASLLAYEEKELTKAAPDALPEIIGQKTALIERLADLERRRDAQLVALGFGGGRKGMDDAAANDPRLASRWHMLQQAVERARRTNASNGMLIRIRMDYNERTLAVLRAVPPRAGFYGPDGRVAPAMR